MIGIKSTAAITFGLIWLMTGDSPADGATTTAVLYATGFIASAGEAAPDDPIVEEPLRPLLPSFHDTDAVRCGTMNGFAVPGVALLAQGMGWLSRGRRDRAPARQRK